MANTNLLAVGGVSQELVSFTSGKILGPDTCFFLFRAQTMSKHASFRALGGNRVDLPELPLFQTL